MKRSFSLLNVHSLVGGLNPDGFELIEQKLDGEWRWGTEHYIVFKDLSDDTFWRIDYREGSGDSEYAWEEDYGGECYQVALQEVVTLEYMPV